ncbi:MAG: sensor histidine kinase, partial [Chloroflexota bacterium]|nr:sensor histidine kinase [Chloroflexota bacterium]
VLAIPRSRPFKRLASRLVLPAGWSLARRYLVSNLIVVLAGVLVISAWVGNQIEESVLQRTAGITALYIDSVIGPHLQALAQDDRWLTPVDTSALNRLVADTGLGQGVILFKIWSLDGRVLYSPDQSLIGQQFPVDSGLARAAAGEVTADMSDLHEPENTNERQRYRRLVEVYAPVRQSSGGKVIAVNEFYLLPDALDAEIRAAQVRSWGIVAGVGALTYVLMAGLVKRGSDTIRRQQRELQDQVRELRRLLDLNARLHDRVRLAAGRTTALNEQALRRISADLHDGPGQALALALLRLDALQTPADKTRADFATVHGAVRDALADVRSISAGLRLPELEPIGLVAVAERAIADHERRSHTRVERHIRALPEQAPVEIKIALLRTLQEALSNAERHAGGIGVSVGLRTLNGSLVLDVTDHGPGFDPNLATRSGGLGLVGMRERAELLGGSFQAESQPGSGTNIRVQWPLPGGARA